MKEKFLPIGTIVLLQNAQKKLMITGYLPIVKKPSKKIYDYSGCIFPEGLISSAQTAGFNHEQIKEIIHEGYSNEETEKFIVALKEIAAKSNADSTPAPAATEILTPTEEVLDEKPETTPVTNPSPTPETMQKSSSNVEKATESLPKTSTPAFVPAPANVTSQPQTVPATSAPAPIFPSYTSNNNKTVETIGVDSIKPFSE